MGLRPLRRRVARMSPARKPTKPVDVYVRVSQTRGRKGDSFQSPKQQEDRCRAQLKADGLKAGRVFTDLDQSGGKASRPAFDQMMARIASGESGGVVVHDLSRFGRSTRNVLDGIEFIESHGGVFISCAEKLDTATSTGRFVLTMFAALRQLELEQAKERWAVSQEAARVRGVHIGNPRAGFQRDAKGRLVEVPEHLEAVKQAFALRARGGTWGETATFLTSAGVPTSRGRVVWSRQSVQAIVGNRLYREPDGPVPGWMWDKAQSVKGIARSARGQGYVLGQGLVRCGLCDAGLIRGKSHGTHFLRCNAPGNGHAGIAYEPAEDYITSLAFSHVGAVLKTRPGGNVEGLRQAVEEAQGAYDAMCEALGVEQLPAESRQSQALDSARASLAEAQATVDTPYGLADFLTPVGAREEFRKLPVGEQRRVLRQVVSRVVLTPGRAHVGARLMVEFTDGTVWPAPDGFGAPERIAAA
jgi:DNA invertase Pin-like site-specific DNA recombinase